MTDKDKGETNDDAKFDLLYLIMRAWSAQFCLKVVILKCYIYVIYISLVDHFSMFFLKEICVTFSSKLSMQTVKLRVMKYFMLHSKKHYLIQSAVKFVSRGNKQWLCLLLISLRYIIIISHWILFILIYKWGKCDEEMGRIGRWQVW